MFDRVVVVEVRPDDTILNNTQYYVQKQYRSAYAKVDKAIEKNVAENNWKKPDIDRAWSDIRTKANNTYFIRLPLLPKRSQSPATPPATPPTADEIYANHKSYFGTLINSAETFSLKVNSDNYLEFSNYLGYDISDYQSYREVDEKERVRLILQGLTANSMIVLRGHGSPQTLGGFSGAALADGLRLAGLSASCFVNLTGCQLGLSPAVPDTVLEKLRQNNVDDPRAIAEAVTKDSFALKFAAALYTKGLANKIHARLRNVVLVTSTHDTYKTFSGGKIAEKSVTTFDHGRKATRGWDEKVSGHINKQPYSKVVINRGASGAPEVAFYRYDKADMVAAP